MGDNNRKTTVEQDALHQITALLTVCPFAPKAQAVLLVGYLMSMRDIKDPTAKRVAQLTFMSMMREHPEGQELCEWMTVFLEAT